MVRLIEGIETGGYMLHRTGNVIPVKYHPYGVKGDSIYDIQYNIACSFFLYLYNRKYKNIAINTLKNYVAFLVSESDLVNYDNLDYIGNDAKNLLFEIFEEADINNDLCDWSKTIPDTKNILYDFVKNMSISDILDEFDESNNGVQDYVYLNQEYTRFRIGGEYDDTNENEIYFRISSSGYDWGEDIVDLVFNKYRDIQFITIERDKESCKLNDRDYKIYTLNGVPINHYPVKDFIFTEKPPILSSVNRMRKIPIRTIVEDFSRMINNKNTILDYLDRMNDIENRFVKRNYKTNKFIL